MDALKGFLNWLPTTPNSDRNSRDGDTIEYRSGTIAMSHKLVPHSDDQGHQQTDEEIQTIASDITLAIALIKGPDPNRYGTLITKFANSYVMGKDEYPTVLSAACSMLVNFKTPENACPRNASVAPQQLLEHQHQP